MVPFTVEEENLICMYHKSDRRRTAANIRAALPDMDEDMAALARQTADKQHDKRQNLIQRLPGPLVAEQIGDIGARIEQDAEEGRKAEQPQDDRGEDHSGRPRRTRSGGE